MIALFKISHVFLMKLLKNPLKIRSRFYDVVFDV